MAKYFCMQIITRELREELPAEIVTRMFTDFVTGQGLHPASEFELTWSEITQQEVDFELDAQRLAGVEEPIAPFRAGDWRVRGVVDVAEDAPAP